MKAALGLAALVLVAGCTTPAASSGTPQAQAGKASTAGPVQACRAPVDGFGVTKDADGRPLPKPTAAPAALPDPRSLTGPTTADPSDDDVHPIASGPAPSLPVSVDSCDGKRVEVTDVSRIIAADLYGTLSDIVFSVGLGDRVVGRDTSTGFPAAADLPRVTPNAHDLNAEAVLALNPTVILTDKSIGPPEVLQQLRSSGIPVVYFDDARTMAGIPSQIRAVAAVLGVPDAGERLVDRTQDEILAALALAPRSGQPLRMTFLYIRGSAGVYLMSGPGSGADAMIAAIGGLDTGTDIGLTKSFTPLTSEALIKAQPELIIMMTKGLQSVGGVDGLVKQPGVGQTPAGQRRRVVDMDDSELLSFGPRTGRTIEALARAVYAGTGG